MVEAGFPIETAPEAYQVRLDSNVLPKHVGDEAVGELVFLVEDRI